MKHAHERVLGRVWSLAISVGLMCALCRPHSLPSSGLMTPFSGPTASWPSWGRVAISKAGPSPAKATWRISG
jgi:hypothetical protein